MTNMKISVGFRWESGLDMAINTLCQIFIYLSLDKVLGYNLLLISRFSYYILILFHKLPSVYCFSIV